MGTNSRGSAATVLLETQRSRSCKTHLHYHSQRWHGSRQASGFSVLSNLLRIPPPGRTYLGPSRQGDVGDRVCRLSAAEVQRKQKGECELTASQGVREEAGSGCIHCFQLCRRRRHQRAVPGVWQLYRGSLFSRKATSALSSTRENLVSGLRRLEKIVIPDG